MKKYIFLFLLSFQAVFSQVQFEAKVSKQVLGINERLRIDFIMNEDGDNFVPPNFEGFRILAGPSQQVSQSWINGKTSFNKSYSYFLVPIRKGIVAIKPATIEIRGHIYRSNAIKINVTNAVEEEADPYNPNQPEPSIGEGVFLVADVSKSNPYLNEPITVVYKLYFNPRVGIQNVREKHKPKYNDFWSQNIDMKKLTAERAKYKGQDYGMVVWRKTVLYPQKTGSLDIEPLSLEVEMEVPTNKRDFFGTPMYTTANKTIAAGNRKINVLPLPENGKPADFSGAVGTFTFQVKSSKTKLKSGESLDLTVSVAGRGNLKLFSLPKPVLPASLELYDPVHTDQVETPLSGMTGKITDTYTIVPQYKGNYPIKPMTFSYFDLETKSYKTISSDEIVMEVLDGPEKDASIAQGNGDKITVTITSQFQYIATKTNLVSTKKRDFFGSALHYSLLLLPLLGIPLLVIVRKKKQLLDSDISGNRIRNSNRLVKKYLGEAKKQLSHKEPFYIALEKAMHNFLKAKLHLETSEMSKDKVQELLEQKNADATTIKEFLNLTESCEFARYAPSSSNSIQKDFDKAIAILSDLEKQLQK